MRHVNEFLRFVMVACFALTMVADAQATLYYVNLSGNDANPGTSAAPFLTIKKAAKVIQSGDTVYVAAGTYTDDIVVNGVQGSSVPAVFIGNSGATVNAQWKVVNSNYVHLTGFAFQGGPTRLLVWKGSYEGLIENCQFTNGDEGLLIKDGSLTIDNCLIQDFAHDGIQVDGEADLLVRASTISGCQEAGIEIRKVAHVTLDNNCNVDSNIGDGIEVNITTDTIDDGPDLPPITKKHLSVGLGKFELTSGFVKGYNSDIGPSSIGDTGVASSNVAVNLGSQYLYGDAYIGASGSVDPAQVTGTITTYTEPMTLPPIDDSYFATNNDNANIPLSDNSKNPLNASLDFTLSGGDGIDLPPGTYYFNKVTLSGGSTIRLSGPVVIYAKECSFSGGSVANPAQKPSDCQIYARAGDISFSGSSSFYGSAYAPLGKVTLSGSSTFYGMLAADQIKSSSSGGIYIDEALLPVAEQIFFDGNGSSPSPTPTPSWVPVTSGELDISISTLSNNDNAVRMVTPQALTATLSDFSNNAWGLRLAGSVDLVDCTVSDNTTGGVWLTDLTDVDVQVVNLTLANNTQYGVYAESCNLTFNSANIADWAISGSQIAIAGVGSDLTFDTITISGGTTAGVQLSQGSLNATSTTFSGSGAGLDVVDANVTLTSCTLSSNTVGLTANGNATVAVTGGSISNNTSYGINSSYSTLTLSGGLTVSGSSTAAVYAYGGNLNVSSSTLSGSGYGIQANTVGAVVIDTCTLSGNTTGLSASQITSLQVNNSTMTGSTQWGASVTPKTGGLSVIFDACTFHSNVGGLSLVNAIDGQVSLRTGTLIRDNTNSALHFANCTLTINDQAGGTAWRTLRNGYGISSTGSTLTLSNVSVEESSLYGVYCENSSVSLANCTVTGVGGVYADAANDSLTIESTRFDAISAGGWGVARYGGDLDVKNCVLNGFDGGVRLSTAFSGDQAVVSNSTLVNLATYGVYLADDDATVKNTVLVGGSGAAGLTQVSGLLTHSHNLLDGFGTPFSGTTADASELLKNPRFVDAANGDFRLAKGSPAINSGADMTASVTVDMLGNARPSHKVFEIGAYEYMLDGGSLRVLGWKEDK